MGDLEGQRGFRGLRFETWEGRGFFGCMVGVRIDGVLARLREGRRGRNEDGFVFVSEAEVGRCGMVWYGVRLRCPRTYGGREIVKPGRGKGEDEDISEPPRRDGEDEMRSRRCDGVVG